MELRAEYSNNQLFELKGSSVSESPHLHVKSPVTDKNNRNSETKGNIVNGQTFLPVIDF